MTETADYIVPPPEPSAEEQRDRRRDELLALLMLLAAISDDDLSEAQAMFEQQAPAAYRGLLDGSGSYSFDSQRQVYIRGSTGHAVSADTIKRVSQNLASGVSDHILKPDTARAQAGELDVEKWAEQMGRDVKDIYLAQGALASGGFERVGEDARNLILGSPESKRGLSFSLSRLAEFGADLNTEPNALGRAGMYGASSNGIYEAVRRMGHERARDEKGRRLFLYEKNLLGDPITDHCAECPDLTAAGWQPIGSMPEPGLRLCGPQCLCSMMYALVPV